MRLDCYSVTTLEHFALTFNRLFDNLSFYVWGISDPSGSKLLLRGDKKLGVASVDLTEVISGLTDVKCHSADSFAKIMFRQPMRRGCPMRS